MNDFTAIKVLQKYQIVSSAKDLEGVLESDIVYLIDGFVDMGSTQIIVPQGGLTMHGIDFNLSRLVTSVPSTTLFIDDGVFAGDVFLRLMSIEVSGAGAQVFDLDNAENGNTVQFTDFRFVNCQSLGILRNYSQGLFNVLTILSCVDGLTLDGTWSGGFVITTSNIVSDGVAFTGTLLKKGAALIVNGSIRSDMNALELDDAGAICDFEPANIVNDAQFLMNGVRTNPNSISFPNMPASSVKANFNACTGTPNTHIGGQWKINSEVATVIATAGVSVKLAGGTGYIDLEHFEGATDNELTYIGTDEIDVIINGVLSLSGTNNQVADIIIRHWDDSESNYIDVAESGGVTLNAAGRAEGVSMVGTAMMKNNDRIEIWTTVNANSTSITALLDGLVIVSHR